MTSGKEEPRVAVAGCSNQMRVGGLKAVDDGAYVTRYCCESLTAYNRHLVGCNAAAAGVDVCQPGVPDVQDILP